MNPTLHQLPNSISRLSKLHAMSLAGSDRISVLNIGTLSLIARGVFKGRSLCSTLMRPLWDICQQHESEDDKMRAMCEAAGIPWQDEV